MVKEPSERPDPDRLLEQIEAEERQRQRGKLKVFLGYASGVGKSLQMLDEARRRSERGEDVVVGAIQPTPSPETSKVLAQLEVVPTLTIVGQDTIDLTALRKRKPQVVFIDGLAYDNPPGSSHARRCDDIEELIAAGISVVTSVNLQYIAEFQDEIESLTGKRAACSVPKSFLKEADEIVVVDAPAHESLRTLSLAGAGGEILAQQQRLSRLREMALLLAAEIVELQLENYLRAHHITETWGMHERILVCLTPRSNAPLMIASGRRNADRFRGELFVAYVRQPQLAPADQASLDANLAIARQHGAQVAVLESADPVESILAFARENNITQIFTGHSMRRGLWQSLKLTLVERLIQEASGIDVRIFPH
jgi:two-component system, OmpR family, sensor histidine kinase KdpD